MHMHTRLRQVAVQIGHHSLNFFKTHLISSFQGGIFLPFSFEICIGLVKDNKVIKQPTSSGSHINSGDNFSGTSCGTT